MKAQVEVPIDSAFEQQIADYLQHQPDFLTRHPNLANQLMSAAQPTLPPQSQRELTQLRQQNQQLQSQLAELITTAAHNQTLNRKLHALLLALAVASSGAALLDVLYERLQRDFNTDLVAIRLFEVTNKTFAGRQEIVEYDAQVFTLFNGLLSQRQPYCGDLSPAQKAYLFGQAPITSMALLPLGTAQCYGMVVMGSYHAQRFTSDMATDVLHAMQSSIDQLLQQWL